MYALVFAALAASPGQPPTNHTDQNAIYKSLTEDGLLVGPNEKVKFPAPSMPDGLDAAKQKAVIDALIGTDYTFAEFTRKATVAPQLLKIHDIKGGAANAPVRGVDVWFVAYGDFKQLEDEQFLGKLVNSGKNSTGKGGPLKDEDLKKRGIAIPDAKDKRESYGTIEFDFLEKVRLRATGHAIWSRTGDSVVAAAEIDPRFLNDKEFPNQWSSINKGAAQPIGPPNPWSGAAMYLKITKLKAPEGALFIEQHVVFVEPNGWFAGANLLRSKLPIAMQSNVRSMRTELDKGK